MVTSGADRTAKAIAKNAPETITLRKKIAYSLSMHKLIQDMFQQFRINWIVDTITVQTGTTWGKKVNLTQLIKRLVFGETVTLQEFINAQFTEATYNLALDLLEKTKNWAYRSVFPPPMIYTSIQVTPKKNTQPLTNASDWLESLGTEQTKSISVIDLIEDIRFVAKTQVSIFDTCLTQKPVMQPPRVYVNQYKIVSFFVSNPVVHFTENISGMPNPVLSNPNIYNGNPQISISVVKS